MSGFRNNNHDYNYENFRPGSYDLATFDGPRLGQPFPNFNHLTDIDGNPVDMATFTGRTLVLETGSVTCPMYAKGIPAMNQLAEQHPDVAFVVLYVREAHPGGRIGRHQSTLDKQTAAAQIASRMQDRRTVLLDDVNGTAHRQLGLLPNMVYVVDADGTVGFRGDWTDADIVAAVVNGTAAASQRATEHYPPAKPRPDVAVRTLLNGGWRALFEFLIGLPGLLRLHAKADDRYRHTSATA